jgi:hypothetical protein
MARKPPRKKKPLSPKIKRQLAAAKGAATRKANRIAAREAEIKKFDAKRLAKAKAKKAKTRRDKARARSNANLRNNPGAQSLLERLEEAYLRMQESAGHKLFLRVERSPIYQTGEQPWLILGAFRPRTPLTWVQIGRIFETWRDDLILEAVVHPDRYAQIRMTYDAPDPRDKGVPTGGYTPAGVGSWQIVIEEAADKLVGYGGSDDPDENSIAFKYADTRVLRIDVLFSASRQ